MQRSEIREEPGIGGGAAAPRVPTFSACAEEGKEHAPELRSHRAAPHHPPLFHAAQFGHPAARLPYRLFIDASRMRATADVFHPTASAVREAHENSGGNS